MLPSAAARLTEPDSAESIDVTANAGCLHSAHSEGLRMWDLIMLAIGLGFFALSIGYTIACDEL